MANLLPFRSAAFPTNDRLYRLSSYGALTINKSNPSEPEMDLVLTPFKSENLPSQDPSDVDLYNFSEERIATIGIGQILDIPVGSILKNGTVVARPCYTRIDINLSFDRSNITVLRAYDTWSDDNKQYSFIPKWEYQLPYQVSGSRYLHLPNIDSQHEKIDGILLSCTECLRYYNTSSYMLQKITTGGLLLPNKIFNPELSYVDKEGVGHVRLRTRLKDDHAATVARVALNEGILQEYRNIHGSIVKNLQNEAKGIPIVYPPFYGNSQMILHGKYIKSGPKTFFLVFWIESCSGGYPFESLRFSRDNDNNPEKQSSNADSNLPKAWPGVPSSRTQPLDEEDDLLDLNNDEEPNLNRLQIEIELPPRNFVGLPTDIKKIHSDTPKTRSVEVSYSPVVPGSKFSTGEGIYNESSTQRVNLSNAVKNTENLEHTESRYLPTEFQMLFNGLKYLKNLSKHFEYEFINLNSSETFSQVSYFPNIHTFKGGDKWTLVRLKELAIVRRRQLVVVRISYKHNSFYLFEAEKRSPKITRIFGENNEVVEIQEKESITTLLLHSVRLEQIGSEVLKQVARNGARNAGKWKKNWKWPDLKGSTFWHKPESVETFSLRFLDYINRIVADSVQNDIYIDTYAKNSSIAS